MFIRRGLWTLLLSSSGSFTSAAETRPYSLFRGGTPPFIVCLYQSGVPISLLGAPNFSRQAEPYNLRLDFTPAAIVYPRTYEDISSVLPCASDSNVKIQARSGGHSYGSYSLGGQNGSLVIDLEAFQQTTVDSTTGIAAVGAGVRLGNLALGIYAQGQRALPHGNCPGVGVGGHFTHGGFSFTSRKWGLSLDTIVGMDVVLSSGVIVHTNATSDPDLFFALRGAAESFGIITTFYLQTFPAPSYVINFEMTFPTVLESKECATTALEHLQRFVQNSSIVDRNLGLDITLRGMQFRIDGMYFNGYDNFKNTILPEMVRGLPAYDPQSLVIDELPWIPTLATHAWTSSGRESLAQPSTGYDRHDTFFAKSILTEASHPLTTESLLSFFEYVLTNGRTRQDPWFVTFSLHGGPDSQINVPTNESSAYPHRSTLWVVQLLEYSANLLPPFNTTDLDFIRGLTDSITHAQRDGQFSAYINYVDPTLKPSEAHRLYYGEVLYQKLLGIKERYDPQGLLWNPQAIGTS